MKIKFEQFPPKPCAVCQKRGLVRFGVTVTKGQSQVTRYACFRKGHAAQVVTYLKMLASLMEEERIEKESTERLRREQANNKASLDYWRKNWRLN